MKIIRISDPKSSEDCKKALDLHLGSKKWKRIFKFGENLRGFQGNDGTIALIGESGRSYTQIYQTLTLDIKAEIEAIRKIAKLYYTHDYGQVFYNPYKKELWISGGDGGYCYSTKKINWDDFKFDESSFVEFNTHPDTSFIKNVDWEAECDPSVQVIVAPIESENAIFFWDFHLGPSLRNYIAHSSWIESNCPAICLTEEEVAALHYQKGLFFTLTEENFTFLNPFEELCNSINSELNK